MPSTTVVPAHDISVCTKCGAPVATLTSKAKGTKYKVNAIGLCTQAVVNNDFHNCTPKVTETLIAGSPPIAPQQPVTIEYVTPNIPKPAAAFDGKHLDVKVEKVGNPHDGTFVISFPAVPVEFGGESPAFDKQTALNLIALLAQAVAA